MCIFFIVSIIVLGIVPGKIRNNPNISNSEKCFKSFVIYYIFINLLYASLGINESINSSLTIDKYPTINVTYLKIIILSILNIIVPFVSLVLSCKFSTSCFGSKSQIDDFEFKKLQNKITKFVIIMMILSIILSLVSIAINHNTLETQLRKTFNESFEGRYLINNADLVSTLAKRSNLTDEEFSSFLSKLGIDNITHDKIDKILQSTINYSKNIIIKVTIIRTLITIPIDAISIVILRDLLKKFYLQRLTK